MWVFLVSVMASHERTGSVECSTLIPLQPPKFLYTLHCKPIPHYNVPRDLAIPYSVHSYTSLGLARFPLYLSPRPTIYLVSICDNVLWIPVLH